MSNTEFHAEVETLREDLEKMEAVAKKSRVQTQFIKSLYFKEIQRRWNSIINADERTNAWLYDSGTKFATWLKADGRSVFYVNGLVSP